jgi:chromosome segregation protein
MRTQLASFIQNRKGNPQDFIVSIPSTEELDELKKTQKELNSEIEKLVKEEKELEKEIEHIRKASAEQESKARDSMREYYELKNEKSDIEGQSRVLALEEESLNKIQNDFNEEVSEVGALVGIEAVRFTEKHTNIDRHDIRTAQEELHKKIERIKIKLEDVGGMGGNDVLKEYEEVTTRDQFLAKELQDIDKAVGELRGLIRELKETIDKEFKVGIEKINTQFQEFFSLMFGGGSAFLSVVVEHKRAVKDTDEEVNLEENEEDLEFERGIEINVTLPQKKVKDLNMLSGGERSLTSIALLFAMSQVNPFLGLTTNYSGMLF